MELSSQQAKFFSFFFLLFILLTASLYKSSSAVWSRDARKSASGDALVAVGGQPGPATQPQSDGISVADSPTPTTSKSERSGEEPARASDPSGTAVEKKTKDRKERLRRRTSGGCTLQLVVAMVLQPDEVKREKLLLELSMAFTSAYLTHAGKGRNKICFGVITDSTTVVTMSDKARRSLLDTGSGQKIMDNLEYYRYDEIWKWTDSKGVDRTGFNCFGRFVGYKHVLEAEASKPEESRRHIIFIDSDIVFLKDYFHFFKRGQENEFDVALTYRMMPKFPINTGVMFFHSARMPQGADFMADVVRTFVEKDYHKRFLGDQYVMNDIIQGLGTKVTIKDKVYEQKATNANGTEILVVHIDHWNFSPLQFCRVPRKAHILHFKGELKNKMSKYYKVIKEMLPKNDPTKLTQTLNRMQAEGRRVRPCKY